MDHKVATTPHQFDSIIDWASFVYHSIGTLPQRCQFLCLTLLHGWDKYHTLSPTAKLCPMLLLL